MPDWHLHPAGSDSLEGHHNYNGGTSIMDPDNRYEETNTSQVPNYAPTRVSKSDRNPRRYLPAGIVLVLILMATGSLIGVLLYAPAVVHLTHHNMNAKTAISDPTGTTPTRTLPLAVLITKPRGTPALIPTYSARAQLKPTSTPSTRPSLVPSTATPTPTPSASSTTASATPTATLPAPTTPAPSTPVPATT